MLNRKKFLNTFISIFFFAILTYILVNYFRDISWQKFMDTNINWTFFCVAALLSVSIRFLYPLIWVFILQEFGQKIREYWKLNFVYAKSWLGRYIPGKVAWIGGKIYFGAQQGLDLKILMLSSPLENVIQIIANLALGLFIMSFHSKRMLDQRLTMFALACLVVLLSFIYPPLFNRIIKIAYKVLRKKELEGKYTFRFSTLFKILSMFIAIGILTGIAFTLICYSVVPSFNILPNFFYLVATVSLGGSIGMLAIFAPSGIGVREGVLTIFLSPLFSKEMILIIVIMMRLTAAIADILFFLVSRLIFLIRVYPTAKLKISEE